jgi:phage/plasmid-associated DNA primase
MANPGSVIGARLPAPVVEPARGDVQEFLKARTVARPNHRVRCGKVYESYRAWCAEQEMEPVSLTRFGTAIAAAGIDRDNRNN